jgi:predicted nucleic acid-binding protein
MPARLSHSTGPGRRDPDAYVASLAASHETRLATFDEALATTLPEHVGLIP